jgi:predicted negative regulator of RcsB-dependent stress response
MSWKFIFVVVLAIGGAVGYYLWHQTPETPKEQTLSGYTQALQTDQKKAREATSAANVTDVQGAVEKYRADKGSLPASLQDLVPDYLDHVPGGIGYDPASGAVSAIQ